MQRTNFPLGINKSVYSILYLEKWVLCSDIHNLQITLNTN